MSPPAAAAVVAEPPLDAAVVAAPALVVGVADAAVPAASVVELLLLSLPQAARANTPSAVTATMVVRVFTIFISPGGYCTTRVPCIVGWTLQWNLYDPGVVGTVNVAGLLGLNGPASNEPSSAVTV